MRIEAVVPCVGFGDYLSSTLPSLLPLVDDLVVSTAPDDVRTLETCFRWGVRAVTTWSHREGGRTFDKARCINAALPYLRRDGWLILSDADTCWPPEGRRCLDQAATDDSCIYGSDRVDLVGWTHWAAYVTGQGCGQEHGIFVGLPTGARWGGRFIHPDGSGWIPPGYFQMWNGAICDDYAWCPGCDADGTDVVHARRWPRNKRVLIPELLLLHLVAAPRAMGDDWHGRTTPEWAPPTIRVPPRRAPTGATWNGEFDAAAHGGPPPAAGPPAPAPG